MLDDKARRSKVQLHGSSFYIENLLRGSGAGLSAGERETPGCATETRTEFLEQQHSSRSKQYHILIFKTYLEIVKFHD